MRAFWAKLAYRIYVFDALSLQKADRFSYIFTLFMHFARFRFLLKLFFKFFVEPILHRLLNMQRKRHKKNVEPSVDIKWRCMFAEQRSFFVRNIIKRKKKVNLETTEKKNQAKRTIMKKKIRA